jgi:hypothetical protein
MQKQFKIKGSSRGVDLKTPFRQGPPLKYPELVTAFLSPAFESPLLVNHDGQVAGA